MNKDSRVDQEFFEKGGEGFTCGDFQHYLNRHPFDGYKY